MKNDRHPTRKFINEDFSKIFLLASTEEDSNQRDRKLL